MSSFYSRRDEYITDEVKSFLNTFRKNVETGILKLISISYQGFKELTEKTFKVSAWPSADAVMRTLKLDYQQNKMFFLLYNELYFRHIFDRCETERDHMWNAFQNYINLFNYLLGPENGARIPEIPDTWLWEMVNSFISQFQYYQHWKNIQENGDALLEFQGTDSQEQIQEKWTVQAVLRYLHALVNAGQIDLQYNPPVAIESVNVPRVSNTMLMLGFYSLIGLLRMHCLVNDYRSAVKVLDSVDLRKKSAISKIDDCYITAHYYLAVCYLMTKRWVDCFNVCVNVLSRYQPKLGNESSNIDDKIDRIKQSDEDLTDKDIYHKRYLNDKAMLLRCYAFLAMTYVLNNKTQRMDKYLLEQLHDMFGDDLTEISENNARKYRRNNKQYSNKSSSSNNSNENKTSDDNKDDSGNSNNNNKKENKNDNSNNTSDNSKKNEESKDNKNENNKNDENEENNSFERKKEAFFNLFLLGCPDFPNTFDLFVDTECAQQSSFVLQNNQFNKFFRLVNLHKSYEISRMRDELKLYRAIPASKLAKQLEFNDSIAFEKELIQLKSKMRQFKRVDGVSSNGEWSTQSDFDFFIKNNDVNVRRVDGSRLGRYTETFVKNIKHIKELIAQNSV